MNTVHTLPKLFNTHINVTHLSTSLHIHCMHNSNTNAQDTQHMSNPNMYKTGPMIVKHSNSNTVRTQTLRLSIQIETHIQKKYTSYKRSHSQNKKTGLTLNTTQKLKHAQSNPYASIKQNSESLYSKLYTRRYISVTNEHAKAQTRKTNETINNKAHHKK